MFRIMTWKQVEVNFMFLLHVLIGHSMESKYAFSLLHAFHAIEKFVISPAFHLVNHTALM